MKLPRRRILTGALMTMLVGCALASDAAAQSNGPVVFVSAFTAGEEGAIHVYRLDLKSGKLNLLRRTTDLENPFFLALSHDKKYLYSIDAEKFGGPGDGKVAAYQIVGSEGELKRLNDQSTRGTASCYLDVDATGKALLVANYSSGSVASLPIGQDGLLGEAASFHQHVGSSVNPTRQKEPHAHSIVVSPDNRYVYAADLGLDQVLCYRLDAAAGKITPNDPPFAKTPAGSGPRHLTFHPNGKRMYVINELSNTLTVFDYDAESGKLTERQNISTLPDGFDGTSYCADVKITPDGRYLYGTNRGHDSLAAYKIGDDGQLTLIAIEPSLGKGPQNLAISKDGSLLLCANMPGKNVAVFRIDGETGRLKSVGEPTAMPSPSCIMLLEK